MTCLRRFLVLALLVAWTAAAPAQSVSEDTTRAGPKVVRAFRDVVAKPSHAVVRIQCDGKDAALGAIVDADGWIITKASDLTGKITVKIKQGKDVKEFGAKLVGVHVDYDLALLKIDAKNLPAIEWRDSHEAKVGKWVASVGPGIDPVAIGVVSVGTRDYKAGDQGPKNANSNSGWMGVELEEGIGGAKIKSVMAKGPAQKAGLKKDDVVQQAGAKKIIDTESLINSIQRLKAGDKVTLKVKRGEENLDIEITLEKRPSQFLGNPQETMGSKLSNRRGGFPKILQHDTVLSPSDCGGPLVDLDGKTVGINIARAGRTETYAIPSEAVQGLLSKLKAGEFAPKEDATITILTKPDPLVKLSEPLLRATSALSKKDKHDTHRPGGQFMKTHETKLKAGATYVIQLESTEFDPYLIVEDSTGKTLAEDDDSGGGRNAKLVFRAPADGTYRIIATSFGPDEVGSYTLTVRQQANTPAEKKK